MYSRWFWELKSTIDFWLLFISWWNFYCCNLQNTTIYLLIFAISFCQILLLMKFHRNQGSDVIWLAHPPEITGCYHHTLFKMKEREMWWNSNRIICRKWEIGWNWTGDIRRETRKVVLIPARIGTKMDMKFSGTTQYARHKIPFWHHIVCDFSLKQNKKN